MPATDIQERLSLLPDETERKAPLYIYSDAYATMLNVSRAHLSKDAWQVVMKDILLNKGIKLWVIDNISSLTSGLDEKDKMDWDPINQWLLDLRFNGISTLFLHHTGRKGWQRGTTGREDNIDFSIHLRTPPGYIRSDGASFIATFDKARISTKDLHLIDDIQFRLIEGEKENIWQWGETKRPIVH